MLTFQDFTTAVAENKQIKFIRDAIEQHRNSDEYKIAEIADEYDLQRNVTINKVIQRFYNMKGVAVNDFTASNNKIASNFFKRLNVQRCTYSLGNGVTFTDNKTKDFLGRDFDTQLFSLAYNALKHSVAFGFWNVDKLHVFPLTEFVPLYDESDRSLRAGIRFWSIDWKTKPIYAVLYEEDGFTKYASKMKTGLTLEEIEPKRAYRQTIAHTEVGGDEVIGEDNYMSLPVVPLWGNRGHQSTLVGMRAAIDSYDIIQSGFANDLTDCAQVYWIVGNAEGMDENDLNKFIDRIRLQHIAAVDTQNSSITPYTQDIPFGARETYLSRISASIYKDFGALNSDLITAGNITATQIRAAYEAMDEEADDFEFQVIEFVRKLLLLNGIDDIPQFKRNRIINEREQVEILMMEANYLDDQTILEKLPNITVDEVARIMDSKITQDNARFEETEV